MCRETAPQAKYNVKAEKRLRFEEDNSRLSINLLYIDDKLIGRECFSILLSEDACLFENIFRKRNRVSSVCDDPIITTEVARSLYGNLHLPQARSPLINSLGNLKTLVLRGETLKNSETEYLLNSVTER